MKIEMSKEEYRVLLESLEIANWVLFASKDSDPPGREKYKQLEQKIYFYAGQFGCEELVKYDEEKKRYYPTVELEETESVRDALQEFEDETFWDELLYRFVERDLLRREGKENVKKMTLVERFKKEEPIEEVYAVEFGDHGIEHLVIDSSQEGV